MPIESVTDLRNTDAGLTAFTVRQNPVGGSTPCHAVQITQSATAGDGAGLNVVSNNTSSPAIRTRAAGPLMQLYNASNVVKFEISNTGAVTLYDAMTLTSLTTTGNVSIGGTLAVTGATTLTGALSATSGTFSTTLGVTGAATLSSTLGVTGATTMTTASTSGAATLNSAVITTSATVGTTLAVTGTTTAAAINASGNVTVTGADLQINGTGKAYRFRRGGGGLDLEATGADLVLSNWSGTNFDGTQRSYFRFSADAQNIQVAGKVEFVDALYATTRHVLDGAANTIGFFGTAAAVKQTASGSRGGNAALASLLTALATYGIITDSSSA